MIRIAAFMLFGFGVLTSRLMKSSSRRERRYFRPRFVSLVQVDPAVPAPAGMALKAPTFLGDFWGKEREVHKGLERPNH